MNIDSYFRAYLLCWGRAAAWVMVLWISLLGVISGQETTEIAPGVTIKDPNVEAGELARLPYQALIELARHGYKGKSAPKSFRVRVESRQKGVRSGDISLYLDRESGRMDLPLGEGGQLTIPFSDALWAENPFIMSNQPRGSLNVLVDVESEPLAPYEIVDGRISYQNLMAPLVQERDRMFDYDPSIGLLAEKQLVLELKTGDAGVSIVRDSGERNFEPNEAGFIHLVLENYLYEENPEVKVPAKLAYQIKTFDESIIEKLRSR